MRNQLLNGNISLPSFNNFKEAIGDDAYTADRMFTALWRNYLKDKGTISLPFWADKFESIISFNTVLKSLSLAGWITSTVIPARNWAEARLNEDKLLEYCSIDELEAIRSHKKLDHYTLKMSTSTKFNATRVNGKIKDTGLERKGSMLAGRTVFSFDKKCMYDNYETIKLELTKSMDKVNALILASGGNLRIDRSSYDAISNQMLEFYYNSNDTYTPGNSYNDSRGRAILEMLSKIGNPISNKTFRALLVIE